MTSLIHRPEGTNDALISPDMKGEVELRVINTQSGKIGWAILWLLGIPLPVLLIAYLIWGR